MLIHEWWTHDLIIPRNRVVGFIFDYIGHILFMTSRLRWRWSHRWHHKYWKTDQDQDYIFKNTPSWFYLFLATPLETVANRNKFEVPEEYTKGMMECYEKNIVLFTPESRFLEKHWKSITVLSHIILIAILGYVNWIYFVLLQAWLFRCYIIGFNEIVTHWPLKITREEETNTPYLFPICCGTAYHVDHHSDPRKIVLGPGKLKYLNIQYWFIKVFFKPAAGAYYS
jgi:fatty-acid desaturase